MRFCVDVPNFGRWADPRDFADFARQIEDAGWDGISLWDHILVEDGLQVADPWVLLSAAAMVTDRIRLITMVTPVPRRHPWKLSRECVSVDLLSEGRLILGVGSGWPTDPEFTRFHGQEDLRVRAEMLDEGLQILTGLWQEGHTAHVTREDAAAYAAKILHEVYADFMVNVLAIPLYLGIKPSYDRFAGAVNTLTCEAMMRDRKALQMGTSHELGQNFAKAFDILYLDGDNNQQHAWTTSWGASTRMVGGLIMAHGDDNGLRIPPALAHIQAVVIVVRGSGAVDNAASKLMADIGDQGVKVRLDDQTGTPLGRRITDWELKGVPVRVEVGPRELADNEVTVVRRDTGEKQRVSVAGASAAVAQLMGRIQDEMLADATEFRDTNTTDATTIDEVLDAAATGFAKVPWGVVAGHDAKAALVDKAVTVRCIQRADGTIPDNENEPDLVAYCARSY